MRNESTEEKIARVTEVTAKTNERIDNLGRKGYRLIQDTKAFCFGMDAVLLAEFAVASEKDRILDLCTGNGVIPILMAARDKGGFFTGIEIQEGSARLAKRNAGLNGLEDRIDIIQGDIKDAGTFTEKESYDVVTCNPPYMINGGGLVNPGDVKAIARHEILMSFEDVAAASVMALRSKGSLFIVHRPRRMTEIFESLRRYRLEPKRMRTVHSFAGKEANMILIEAVKDGGCQMIIDPPLIIYKEDGTYTQEVKSYYG